jgi:hypothetical protein
MSIRSTLVLAAITTVTLWGAWEFKEAALGGGSSARLSSFSVEKRTIAQEAGGLLPNQCT